MDRLLSLLAVLACPIGMGVMMWLMTPGGRHGTEGPPALSPLEARERTELERLRAATHPPAAASAALRWCRPRTCRRPFSQLTC